MIPLRVQPIVEGHGEVSAAPILIRRICSELLGEYVEVLHPIRLPRSQILRPDVLPLKAGLAGSKLRYARPEAPGLVLVLVDGDGELPCSLGPELLGRARMGCSDQTCACVIANLEFETWFVAAATSLQEYLRVGPDEQPERPEVQRLRKKWIEDRFRGPSYSETLDQPRLTARMDLAQCRGASPSFDKLCRDLERALCDARVKARLDPERPGCDEVNE